MAAAARMVYAYQQPPRPEPPVIPAPERNPFTGVVEAMVPAGDLPVKDDRFIEGPPRPVLPAPPDPWRDVAGEVDRLRDQAGTALRLQSRAMLVAQARIAHLEAELRLGFWGRLKRRITRKP